MSYPIETKIALVREYEQGKKVAEVSKTSGIPENSIYRWMDINVMHMHEFIIVFFCCENRQNS